MKLFKKALALTMVLAMALALTACGDTSWVYKYDNTTVSSGTYLAYLMDAYSEVSAMDGLDTEKNVLSQTLEDGTKTADKMVEIAGNNIKKALYAKSGLEKLGVELNDEYFTSADTSTAYYWNYFSQTYVNNGVGQESYKEYNRLMGLAQAYFEKIYGEGGEKEIATQDLLDYFKDNYIAFQVISAQLTEEGGDVDAETAEALNSTVKARLDGYVTELNSGADYATVLAKENAATGAEGEDANQVADPAVSHKDDLAANYSEDFSNAVQSLTVGKAAAVEINGYYAVVVRCELDATENAAGFTNSKTGVMSHLKGEEYSDWLDNQIASMDVTVNNGAISYLAPSKLEV